MFKALSWRMKILVAITAPLWLPIAVTAWLEEADE
jgi:hypothetical protein